MLAAVADRTPAEYVAPEMPEDSTRLTSVVSLMSHGSPRISVA